MSYQPPQDPQQPSWPQGEPTYPPVQPYPAPPTGAPLGSRAPLTLSNGETGTSGPAYGNGLPYAPANVPYGQPGVPYGWVAPPVAAKRKKLPFVLGGIGAVLALCMVGGVVAAAASDGSDPTSAAAQPSAAGPTAKATKKPAAKPTTKPTAKPTAKATTAPTVAEPVVTAQPIATSVPTAAYRKLTARAWQLIVKNPDGHAGEKVIVYGRVFQFDAATGTDMFRADAGFSQYEDPSDANTEFAGDAGMLADLVEGDLFRAEAVVIGANSYDTQDGGNTTVPKLQVTSIKVL